ncbi:MAG TPA: carboxylating nicotinate-nucleotide diphosphorylase [Dehalococcoidia bacterium]|nr:carboxylating nicotinate-nucleotide diphosphorylase [Dehalococcoidia bacterium]
MTSVEGVERDWMVATPPDATLVRRLARMALDEDGAWYDVTTMALVPPQQRGTAVVVAREAGVLCGAPGVAAVYEALGGEVRCEPLRTEGSAFHAQDELMRLTGPLARILQGERVSLNFLQRLSGIATLTRSFVDAVVGTNVRIVDTRKTTPGLRLLEKYAVRVGGGANHRFGLHDGVLVKDNHIAAGRARGLTLADIVRQARRNAPHPLRIEVEVTSVAEAHEALEAGAEALLLDNMTSVEMAEVARLVRGRVPLEASGGITLERVRDVAEAGVDLVSVGALTHSARAVDLSLEVVPETSL